MENSSGAEPRREATAPKLAGWMFLIGLAFAAFPGPARAQAPPQERPNILWISAEDLSPRLGAYGDSLARTPNLDRLAAEGVVFTNAFAAAGVCAPSRSAIITGMYQTSIGTHHMRTSHKGPGLPTPYESVPPPYVKAFPEYLRYRNRMPIMQELLRLHAAAELEGPARLWMRDSRPPEELYDTKADPHEIQNLAGDPAHRDVLKRMRRVMKGWMERIDDMGHIPEAQMVRQMWPEMEQPETHIPIFIPRRSTTAPGEAAEEAGRTFEEPMEVAVYCPTQGASIEFRIGEKGHWILYSGPIRFDDGTTTIQAKAIRHGYKPSEIAQAEFIVEGG